MALIIKADMPKGCEWTDNTSRTGMGYCPFKDRCKTYRNEVSKQYTINAHPIDYLPSDCPILGEIPDEHGDLIDANAVEEKAREIQSKERTLYKDALWRAFDDADVVVEATT